MTIYIGLSASLDGERQVVGSLHRLEHGTPLALVVGCGCSGLVADAYCYLLASVGCAMYVKGHVALQYHVVGVKLRNLQSAIVARNAAVHGLGKYAGSLGIGMYGVGKEVGIGIQRLVEVDKLSSAKTCYGLYGGLNLAVPLLSA